MSELRRDRTTGAWVIIAPERGQRPWKLLRPGRAAGPLPAFDPSCPFCPGNEKLLPSIIDEIRCIEAPGWRTRVVPNKYPALQPDAAPPPEGAVMSGLGYHEVIIETGRHDADLTTLFDPELDAILWTYRKRYVALAGRPSIKSVVVFRNHGGAAGASLAHPHSQIIALPMVLPRLDAIAAWAQSGDARRRQCVICQELTLELESGLRIVEVSECFVVVVPFAAPSPFELWIVPRRHEASFAQGDNAELDELGRVLQRALYRLKVLFGDLPYKFAFESWTDAEMPSNHWRLRIVPGLVTPGGFELGAGLPINPSRPEDDAKKLRAAPAAP
jgi:UDPglucose--hexose-1-phosphate uridylyltransferase